MAAALSIADWKSEASRLRYRNQAYIDGRYVDAASGKTFECVNPASGEVLTHVASCDAEDVDRAVKAARAAFEDGRWSRAAPRKRKKVLQRFRALRAASVWVNCFDAGDMTTPFGGYKQSGFGRDKSLHAMEKYTELKATWIQLDG